jgi:succinate dehydrogenase/fumarate reductase flavoprotein subunit
VPRCNSIAGVPYTGLNGCYKVAKIAELREKVKSIGLKDKSKIFNTARIEA